MVKMHIKTNILIFLILTVNFSNCLKSTVFCILKQKECKGFYDKNQNYEQESSIDVMDHLALIVNQILVPELN